MGKGRVGRVVGRQEVAACQEVVEAGCVRDRHDSATTERKGRIQVRREEVSSVSVGHRGLDWRSHLSVLSSLCGRWGARQAR